MASDALTCPRMRPAVKMGTVTPAPRFQIWAGPENRLERSALATPYIPVSDTEGKYAALATPIRALAEIRSCSACRISGRCSRRSDGRPAGTGGRFNWSMVSPRATGPGLRPKRRFRAFSCWAMLFSIRGIVARVFSYSERIWLSSSSETTPASKRIL